MNSRLAAMLQTIAHPTPAEAEARAAWAEAQTERIDPWVNQVIHGDCLQVMRRFPSESIDETRHSLPV